MDTKKFRTEEEQRQAITDLLHDVMHTLSRERCGFSIERGKNYFLKQYDEIKRVGDSISNLNDVDKYFGSATRELMQKVASEGSDILDEISPRYLVTGDHIYLMQTRPPNFGACWGCHSAEGHDLWIPKLDELLKAGSRTAGLEGSTVFCMDEISCGLNEIYPLELNPLGDCIGEVWKMDLFFREGHKVKDVLYGPIGISSKRHIIWGRQN